VEDGVRQRKGSVYQSIHHAHLMAQRMAGIGQKSTGEGTLMEPINEQCVIFDC